jgi:hypothetical protein
MPIPIYYDEFRWNRTADLHWAKRIGTEVQFQD